MKINFTKKEYRTLVEMLAIADWMLHAHIIGDEGRSKQHDSIRIKIYSYFNDFGAEDLIEKGEEHDVYYEQNKLMDPIYLDTVREYNEEVFWQELIDRLAERDVVNNIGKKAYSELEFVKRIGKIEDAKEQYIDAFEKYGLSCIRIEKQNLITAELSTDQY